MTTLRKVPVISAPAVEPITRQWLKDHTKIEYTAEDDLIDSYIKAERIYLEEYTRRKFITQTVVEYADTFLYHFPLILELAPVQSITSVEYIAEGDTDYTTLASTVYDSDIRSEPAFIELAESQSWPALADKRNAVRITYIAGYGDEGTDVPEPIRQAIALRAASNFFRREDSEVGRYKRTSMKIIEPYCRWYY